MGSFWRKYMMLKLKKYRRVMFHDTEEWCKIWREIDLSFQNWHNKFLQKLTRALERLKNFYFTDFNGLLLNKVHNVWVKENTHRKELYLMALKIDVKFEGKLTCAFQNDMRM